jgi:hypothetical protein
MMAPTLHGTIEDRTAGRLASGGGRLESRFLEAGLALSGRPLPLEAARALPTTWAKKLGFSGKQRSFREFKGRAV